MAKIRHCDMCGRGISSNNYPELYVISPVTGKRLDLDLKKNYHGAVPLFSSQDGIYPDFCGKCKVKIELLWAEGALRIPEQHDAREKYRKRNKEQQND